MRREQHPPPSTTTYTIGGTVSGLGTGASVILLDNGGDALTVTGNGAFTFATSLAGGAAYAVTVGTQPSGEICTVSGGSGTVGTANVTSVAVSCAANSFTIGGTVSGLISGGSVMLLDNGGDALTVTANGAFTFKTALASGAAYAVTVGNTAPAGETCTVSSGSGTVGTANITNVSVSCIIHEYTIGGTVSGLLSGASVVLLDNGGNALTVTANGPFNFLAPVLSGTAYTVTVGTQPTGETCTVIGGSGTAGTADITSVVVSCAANVYTIGGTVSGLISGASVVLLDNGGDALTVTANGPFTFATPLASGAAYAVTVGTEEPTGEVCTVSSGSDTVGTTNISSVRVSCLTHEYILGGTVSGLASSASVVLLDNGGDALTVTTNGPFNFLTSLVTGAAYAVTVGTQPTGQTCTVSDGSGIVGTSNITNVAISCATTIGSGSGGFWIPYSATAAAASGGQNGLFVIASNSIASSPAPKPTFVTTSVPTALGAAAQGFVSGTTPPSSVTPALIMYAAVGSDGNTHVYGLDLTDASTPPVPVQISNLSVPPSEHICSFGQVEGDLATPSSLAVVMYVTPGTSGAQPGTVGYCGANPGTYELAHYTDGPTDTPLTLNIPGASTLLSALINDVGFTALYQTSGQLGGIVLWDASTSNYLFFSDATFTSSTTLLSNVGLGVPCVDTSAISNVNFEGGSRLLLSVATASGAAAYQITASGGTPQQFFPGTASSCATDANNLYFIGTPSGSSTSAIYQEPLAATPPAQMLVTLPALTATSGSSLIGSNDSLLLYQNHSESAGGITTSVFSVPKGVSSTSGAAVGGPYSGTLDTTFLASPTGNAANDFLFLTAMDETGSVVSYSSQVLTTGGTLAETFPNHTVLGSFGPLSPQLDGNLLEIDGITDTNGGYGGGTINTLNVAFLTPARLTAAGGSPYTVPAGYLVGLSGFYGTSTGTGFMFSAANPTAPYIGVAVDLSQHVVLPINLANSSVVALF